MAASATRPRALVTGGSGFLGTHLVARLVELGWAVRCATRARWDRAPAGVEVAVVGEVGPATDWAAALDGAEAVFHLAARAHVLADAGRSSEAEFERVNVAGSARLARAAALAGVRRLVYVSTIGVHGDRTDGAPLDESSPFNPATAYARSKMRGEEAIRMESPAGRAPAILRPPLVYGAGVPGNLRRMLRLVASGVPLPLASVRNRRSLVAAGNLVDALVLCGERPEAAGRVYVVADGEDLATPELVRALAGGLGVPARLLPVPPAALRFAARLAGREALYRQLCGSLQVNARRIQVELGWRPRLDARSALRATGRWYANERRAARERRD
jgi:nucleoside-diphosphate-sugar epimerase